MTVASLVVNLEANTATYLDNMEKAAHHTEMVGRRITRAGMEITKVFAPLAALYAGALAAAVKQSEIVHGQLAQQFDHLTLSARLLLREIGGALTPAFERMIASKEQMIQKVRQLVAWFEQLSPKTQDLIIKVGLFLAVLGPTIVVVGSLIRAAGALWGIFAQLASLISGAVVAAIEFLASPIGLITIAVLGLAAVVFLLIRHWDLVKQVAAADWQEIKAIVLDAAIGILTALTMIPAGTPIFGGLGAAASAAIPKIVALRDTVQHAATEMYRSIHMDKPLLPEWMTNLPAKIKSIFTLPAVPPLPSLPVLQAQDALAKLDTQLKENAVSSQAFGSSFDLASANAQAYKTVIDELIHQGIGLDQVLNSNGLTIRKLAAEYKYFADQVHVALGPYLASAIQGVATAIGNVVAGATKSLAGFGKALLGVVGQLMQSLGAALIALGTAKLAALSLDPFAAIAIGTALVAFGAALSAASQAVAGVGSGGGGAAAPAVGGSSSSSQPSQGSGTIVLELHGGRADFTDPRDQDALAQALQALSGRNVKVVYAGG